MSILAAVVSGSASTVIFIVLWLSAPKLEVPRTDRQLIFRMAGSSYYRHCLRNGLAGLWGFDGEKVRKQPALQSID
jgi:hypothetical protein